MGGGGGPRPVRQGPRDGPGIEPRAGEHGRSVIELGPGPATDRTCAGKALCAIDLSTAPVGVRWSPRTPGA